MWLTPFRVTGLLKRSPFCHHLKHLVFSTPKLRDTTIYKLQCSGVFHASGSLCQLPQKHGASRNDAFFMSMRTRLALELADFLADFVWGIRSAGAHLIPGSQSNGITESD